MRYSKTFIPTVKEAPADAEITSHKLMIRAGMMRKVASGTYFYLPAGWRVLMKIMKIVREEMDRAGALEVAAPMIQPLELWEKTGRVVDYGETLGKFTDRHKRGNVLSPTAEEVMTYIAGQEINSYKQLPFNLYQINLKYRDEFRPRFGVLRSREFMMKDAYSFHADDECLDKTYKAMYDAYCRVFTRCGLEYVIVQAESGEMGGSGSHQFTIPCENGEDVIVYTEDNAHAWNIEKAPVDPLPKQPAQDVGPTEDIHTPNVGSIESVCEFLKAKPTDLIKTLIYVCEDNVVAALVRGDHELNHEKLTQIVEGKHIELADEATIEKVTNAKVGFAGPVDLTDKISMLLIDHAVAAMPVGITGANKTDYHTKNVVPGRDFPLEGENVKLVDIRSAAESDTYDGKKFLFKRGIEVGQVFKLGTKYSTKLDAKFLDADGTEKPCLMGCYGIGINRIMASAVENGSDKDGVIFPVSIAPWEVIITPAGPSEEVAQTAEKIYKDLSEKGIETILDDRNVRTGVKFKDADLIGIPLRITVGERTLAEGKVEIKIRGQQESTNVNKENALTEAVNIIESMKEKINAKLNVEP